MRRGGPGDAHRLKRKRAESQRVRALISTKHDRTPSLDCGWGRLIFAHTFDKPADIAERCAPRAPTGATSPSTSRAACRAGDRRRRSLFLDPSHTYRLDLATYRPARRRKQAFFIRRLSTTARRRRRERDLRRARHGAGAARNSSGRPPRCAGADRAGRGRLRDRRDPRLGHGRRPCAGLRRPRAWRVALVPRGRRRRRRMRGLASRWCAVWPNTSSARGSAYVDFSVLHDNEQAIGLYEKLDFRRAQVFAVKRKNVINEKLYVGQRRPDMRSSTPMRGSIVDEARRRGIHVEVIDAEGGLFRLTYGGRSVLLPRVTFANSRPPWRCRSATTNG
jgi:hypothetical protein